MPEKNHLKLMRRIILSLVLVLFLADLGLEAAQTPWTPVGPAPHQKHRARKQKKRHHHRKLVRHRRFKHRRLRPRRKVIRRHTLFKHRLIAPSPAPLRQQPGKAQSPNFRRRRTPRPHLTPRPHSAPRPRGQRGNPKAEIRNPKLGIARMATLKS